MIILAILLMISELLIGIFIHNNFLASHNSSVKPEVLAEVKILVSPSPSQFLGSTDIEKPSSLPVPSLKPKTSVKPSAAVKSIQTSKLNSQSILQALNEYRAKNGIGSLSLDDKLQIYAQERADYLRSLGKLDKHAGHKAFMANDGFGKLGFNAVAENQSYNYRGSPQELIEKLYGKSLGHNKNQLNLTYTHVGIGISGAFTNLVFGGKRR